MKKKTTFWVIPLWIMGLVFCAMNGYANGNQGTVTDIDGNVYRTVVIGNQEWMAENLRTTKYADGSDITTGVDSEGWSSEGAYAVYAHENVDGIQSGAQMADAYGKMYNWYAVTDPRGLCPEGWRVPSDDEWTEMTNYLINNYDHITRRNVGSVLKSRRQVNSPLGGDHDTSEHPRWDADDTHHGTDDFGFSGLPGGSRFAMGMVTGIGEQGIWWTSTEARGPANAWYRSIRYYGSVVQRGSNMSTGKNTGMSVRCIRAQ